MLRFLRWPGEMYRSRQARSVIGLACLALLLIAVNVLAARYLPQRLDLTEDRLYTLSHGTLTTLTRIDEPITLRFYYSPQLGAAIPSYGVYAERVRQMLGQYVAAAHGKLHLEAVQPQPFSAEEDRAVAFGLQGVPLSGTGEQVYFGLAGTNSTDDQQVIPFFDPQRERLLEYDLTRLVRALAVPKRTVVGVISSLPLDKASSDGKRPSAILQQLRQLDDVETLPTTLDVIPPGTDVLMLVHPAKLPSSTLFAIDQFVLRGGRAVVFVDPYSEVAAHGAQPDAATASDLPALFKAWGLKLLPDTIATDRSDARRVGVPTREGGSRDLDYIAWLTLHDASLNRADPITADLRRITMATSGILEPVKGAGTNFEPLISTSPESMKLPAAKVAGLPDVAALLAQFKSDNRKYVLAARITGTVDTAFPDGPPKTETAGEKPGSAAEPPKPAPVFLKQSAKPVDVVVIADTDMLDDRFWSQSQDFYGRQVIVPVADNGDFVEDAVEVLTGGSDLVGLRSRGTSVRPFNLIENLQRAADSRYAAEQQKLEKQLKETQAKLRNLTTGEPKDANVALAPEQARAVAQFRADMLTTRRQLRDVQAALRLNIDNLKTILEFVDIALMPIIVAAAALVLAALRRRRWRRRPASLPAH